MFHVIRHRSRSVFWRLCLTCCCFVSFGCGDETLDYSEVKRIKEKVTESELQTFLRIIEALPEKKLPKFPTMFAPPPDWKTSRTLPGKQLIQEEAKLIDQRWNAESLARHMQRKRKLQRILRRERMTLEQFIGLSRTIGVTLSRNTLRDNQNFKAILKKGDKALAPLSLARCSRQRKRIRCSSKPSRSTGQSVCPRCLRRTSPWSVNVGKI